MATKPAAIAPKAAKPVVTAPRPPKGVPAAPAVPTAQTRRIAFIAASAIVVVVALAGSAYYMRSVRPMHQIGTAQAWNVLQMVEAEHRSDSDRDSVMLLPNADHSRYTLLGLPTGSERLPRAWIILNQWTPGAPMKMIPANAHVRVECGYVEQMLRTADVEAAVRRFLRTRCTQGNVTRPQA